ncbi:MAG: dTMP kinase [Treponema sp.]|jgi:dTMP kinase|nr:dTMP kinase [Treponema sp.]
MVAIAQICKDSYIDKMEIIKRFVVFEGGDGSGTSTQIELLRGKPGIWTTCEPTDGPIGRIIRSTLRGETALRPETLALLFTADRTEHLFAKNGVIDHCNRGEIVVSDRYTLSSLVYQGILCGDLPSVLNKNFPLPELLFLFDIDPRIAARRIENRSAREIYEYFEFQERVRERYKTLAPQWRQEGVRVAVIDASNPIATVAKEIAQEIDAL